MTGLERNADVVHLTSYAPLMAHADGWQWKSDLIWFNNLTSFGTPNYYVQKLFSTNRGTDLLRITQDGRPLTGQNALYASAVKDEEKGELIVKLVNTANESQEVVIDLKEGKTRSQAILLTLSADDLDAENSFEKPRNVFPVENAIRTAGRTVKLKLPAHALSVLKVTLD